MKIYNEKKVCFIICTNNEQYLEECLLYLSLLEVPEGYETEVLTIEGAKSMTSGYNEGMNTSNAKYKVYIHQDTLITERKLIQKLLNIFQSDSKIGLVGLVGSADLPKDGVIWHGDRCGDFYRLDMLMSNGYKGIKRVEGGVQTVDVVDGLFMATQYDIPWREDILKGWDFYDVSQCLEFRRAGYRVVIPAQNPAWVIHVCGVLGYWHDNKNREVILREYREIDKKEQLRVLFIHSDAIRLAGLIGGLMELGHDVTELPVKIKIEGVNHEEEEFVTERLEEGHYDLVVTYDFIESVSNACQKECVKYYSWVYDCPLLPLYTKAVKNDINYISVFDRKQFERLQNMGIAHLAYFPLATEVDLFGAAQITKKDEQEYGAEISFVGSLYEKRGFEKLFLNAPQKIVDEVNGLLAESFCIWDGNHIFDKASKELIEYVLTKDSSQYLETHCIDKRYFFESMRLARKCNERERVAVLNEVAKKYNLTLYTKNTEQIDLVNVTIKSQVAYLAVMPKVFHLSKINLNITSRSIESGIPQRVWDIMAVGGFCLTNYQPELEDYFEIGKDLEVYHNLDELIEKIEYYLTHEEARLRIALSGYKKVRKNHSYKKRLEDILKWIAED